MPVCARNEFSRRQLGGGEIEVEGGFAGIFGRITQNYFQRYGDRSAELARIARELHRRRVFHKDLYFCHFYIDESFTHSGPSSWTNRVVMIDLHRLGRNPLAAGSREDSPR